ncbi:MAG: UDP-N-acetylmuramate dehydrogenase [Planctomycetes bacterium]|nr:UDP-N-acetylmuramate dehydrogenase [Planctomycetota bacterium]
MENLVHLSNLTTFGLGGAPLRYFRPKGPLELREALRQCRRLCMPWRALGGGSNVLVEDGRLPFAVIHMEEPSFAWIRRTGATRLRVGAGARIVSLLAFCRREELEGLEFLAGLPGTVGGAIAGNAGARGKAVADALRRVWTMTPDGRCVVSASEELRFGYRHAEFGEALLMEAEFELARGDRKLIALRMGDCARARRDNQPIGISSAGCIFKNPPGCTAGALLERCGMKGRRIGGAEVSAEHANFILNRGAASSRDVLELIREMKEAVRSRFGIELELEVRHWPAERRAA